MSNLPLAPQTWEHNRQAAGDDHTLTLQGSYFLQPKRGHPI